MSLTVRFELTGMGWIDIHLDRDGNAHHLEGLSYLTPVLDDVLRMAVQAATGMWRAEALFELEPGTKRLRFEQSWNESSGDNATLISIQRSPLDLLNEPQEADFQLEWEVEVSGLDEFASAVLDGAKALEARLGHDGYANEWVEHPFPVRALAALEAALAIDPLPPPPMA